MHISPKNQRNLIAGTAMYLLISLMPAPAQIFSFKNWGDASRLPDTYIYNINQDEKGFLWVATGSGLVRFDGFDFHQVFFPDSLGSRYVSSSFRDSSGRLWLGCNDGAIFYTRENDLVKLEVSGVQGINQITGGEDGYIYIIPQDRMILKVPEDNPDDISRFHAKRNISMTTASVTPDGRLLLGTQENLLYCSLRNDSVIIDQVLEGIEYTKVQSIWKSPEKSQYLVGTEGSGIYLLQIQGSRISLRKIESDPLLEYSDVRSITGDADGKIWIATYGSGLVEASADGGFEKLRIENVFNTVNGLQGNNVRAVFRDMEDNLWIGLYGEGLSMMGSAAFSFFAPSEDPDENNIIFIGEEGSYYFIGTPESYYLFNPKTGRKENAVSLSRQMGRIEISSYHKDGKKLWFGTRGGGVYMLALNGTPSLFYRSGNTGEDYVRNITGDEKYIWLSTLNGVVILDKKDGSVRNRYKIEDRLPHNSINQVYLRKDGTGLVATENDRLYTVTPGAGISFGSGIMSGLTKNKVLCYTETGRGVIFAGTSGNGLFYFSGDSVFNISVDDGLFSNYCYSLMADREEKIWIGHERGFSRYNSLTGSLKVFPTEFARGGDCNPNAIFQASDGKILIGTTEGLVIYDRSKERTRRIAPINNIISVTINNRKYPPGKEYSLPYDKYTVRIDYAGINLSDPGKVYYSTRMDNFDDVWSELKSERSISYPLRDGRYRFNLTSVNQDGLSQEEPLYFDIFIKKPFWRTLWFMSLMFMVAVSAVVLIVREREKAQRKIKEYLESELAERTKLVLKQKDEIELQNIEITDSINYAKRIQSSILPDVNKLGEAFGEFFLIFHPRDIVSGDFYWFDRIDDEKFMLVCADSTGHGVPGAFMSMIGSALLQDIILRRGVTRPSKVLGMLDEQIFSTLNQNIDVGVSNDGMDMIVCEINVRTRFIRFASAMRPVIIIMGGESFYIKGNRCSIGGESVVEKYFDDQEYYLSKGDTIYMFSDGLPDQFGGSDGKKMKIARLKRLIDEVSSRPMSEQKQLISDFYFNWKGEHEQVDDILLMGIRL